PALGYTSPDNSSVPTVRFAENARLRLSTHHRMQISVQAQGVAPQRGHSVQEAVAPTAGLASGERCAPAQDRSRKIAGLVRTHDGIHELRLAGLQAVQLLLLRAHRTLPHSHGLEEASTALAPWASTGLFSSWRVRANS